MAWNATLLPPGLPRDGVGEDQTFFDENVIGPAATGVRPPVHPAADASGDANANATQGWLGGNCTLVVAESALRIRPDQNAANAFIFSWRTADWSAEARGPRPEKIFQVGVAGLNEVPPVPHRRNPGGRPKTAGEGTGGIWMRNPRGRHILVKSALALRAAARKRDGHAETASLLRRCISRNEKYSPPAPRPRGRS
jgi:hypothetical protein